jgi:uncharacterized protein (TIGR02145 family)
MKKLYILLALIATIATFAQAPQGFNYQATVRNNTGTLIVNQNVNFKFNIMLNSATSLPIFSETHMAPTDDLGQVSLVIGRGTATTGTFSTINWGSGSYFLGIELNTGSGYVAMGTTQLLSVPYALYANSSGNSQAATPNLASVLAVNNGANNLQIKNLADPTDAKDAVNKSFLSTQLAQLQAQITELQNAANVAPLPNIAIGTQTWSSSNLDVATYRDGTPIPQVTDPAAWANLTTGAWCYYANNAANRTTYAKLYNWYAVAGIHDNDPTTPNKILAPTGWHIPTNNEWITLTTFLGENISGSNYGGKMKATGTTFWTSPNVAATNESGFTGLPGGSRDMNGLFVNLGTNGNWWSSSEINASTSWSRYLNYNNGNVGIYNLNKSNGYSVRCVKDAPQVGNSYQGGIIAYLFQPGDFGYDPLVPHGIIVANQDLPVKYIWGSGGSPTIYAQSFQSISNDIGRGKLNTDTILSVGANLNLNFPAAQVAKNYTNGIYSDWFLPSLNDLIAIKNNLARNNLGNFDTTSDTAGDLSTGYWSSSVMANYVGAMAPLFDLNSNVVCGCAVFETYYVRPVRYF